MKYDRFVYIILRDGRVRAVVSRASTARLILAEMRNNSMPTHTPTAVFEDYMRRCAEEQDKWSLEKWPISQKVEV